MGKGLDWLGEEPNTSRIHGTCYNLCFKRGRLDLEHDVFDAAVDKADQAMDTWKPDKGASISTHMIVALRWFMYKKLCKLCAPKKELAVDARDMSEMLSWRPRSDDLDDDSVAARRVDILSRRLDVLGALVMFMRHECGMSMGGMATALRMSKNAVKRFLTEAEETAAEALSSLASDA